MRSTWMGLIVVEVMMFTPGTGSAGAETVADLHLAARAAFGKGKTDEALTLAGKAIALEPTNAQTHYFRGTLNEALRRNAEAVADFDKALQLDARLADAYDRRGSEQFKLGRIKESVADFDKYLELRPEHKPRHWKRGISYYYTGQFDEGKKQFEGYQTFDSNDVENAVWRYLCMARANGVEKARAEILKIGDDRRVPMRQIYDLYRGQSKPEEVLAAARAGQPDPDDLNERLFYAHLYLGLYHEAAGDKKLALEHLRKAAEDHRIGHYMWDVARVHYQLLKK
jgi:lipoprotein NlpI